VSADYSTNLAAGSVAGQDGAIIAVAPGISVDSHGARLKGYLDYQLNTVTYPNHSEWNGNQNQLASSMTLEGIEKWFYVDAAANIFQRQRSLFGPVSTTGSNSATGQGDTKVGQVSPYIRGRLFGENDYQLKLTAIESQSQAAVVTTTRVQQLLGTIGNRATAGTLGWFSDVNATRLNNDVIGHRENTRGRLGLVFPITSQLHATASTGRENTDYASGVSQSVNTPGYGVEWAPDRHTQVAVVRERRFFGTGHSALFSYRTHAMIWRYSDVRDVTILPTLPANAYAGTIHDMMADLLAASNPDPNIRAQAVRERVNGLGSTASMAEGGGASTSRLFIDRVQEASVAYLGVRDYTTLIFRRRQERLLSTVSSAIQDDFSLANDILERGVSISWVHRLSQTLDLGASSARLIREGLNGATTLRQTQTTYGVTLTARLNPKASAAFGGHRTLANGTGIGETHETMVGGSLMQRF
jgi:uncharacterized protein (PEP-CTERM system associated)